MKRRNWIDLSRKLVDRYDLIFQEDELYSALGAAALASWGEGVLITNAYPNPFAITPSGISLGGTVGPGIAYDPTGQIIVDSALSTAFVVTASHPTLDRWDLLVLRYKTTGTDPIPKPSNPIVTVSLNLADDFDLVVIPGTASLTPAYPAKLTNDVIVKGLQVPAAATLGTQILLDDSVTEKGSVPAARVMIDSALFEISRQLTVQDSIKAFDSFLKLGTLTVGDDGLKHDFVTLTCTSGGTLGHFVTIAGQTFTIGNNVGAGEIPVQASATALGFALARAIRERTAFLGVYTAASAAGKVAVSAIASGAVGGAVAVSGATFTTSGAVLAGNGARVFVTRPGLKAQLDQIDGILSEAEFNAGNSGAALAVDFSNGKSQLVTVTADTVLTLSGGLIAGTTYKLRLVGDATGSRGVTFAGPVVIKSGAITLKALETVFVTFFFDGTNFYGNMSALSSQASAAVNLSNYASLG